MKNLTFNCPSCGASISFQSALSVFAVCSFCRSMVIRKDINLEIIGEMATLPEDISPIQIGTTGNYDHYHFVVLGRMRIGWADGYWNEWFIGSDQGKTGWLAEAQGFYAISFELEPDQMLNNLKRAPNLGSKITLNKIPLTVMDIKKSVCVGSEGELPFSAPSGRITESVDLLGEMGEFGCIEFENKTPRIYLGRYVEWDDMRLQNLRPIEGW